MKYVSLTILAISLTFILTLFYSCNNSNYNDPFKNYKKTETITPVQPNYPLYINHVLQKNHNIKKEFEDNPSLYATEMRKISLVGCPNDFSVAYVEHIHAWENTLRIYEAIVQLNSEENLTNLVFETLVDEFYGNSGESILNAIELEKKLREQLKIEYNKVQTTYQNVEKIAVSYGATLIQ